MTKDELDPSTAEFPPVDRRGAGPGLYDHDRHPRQRVSDAGWRYWMLWVYRLLVPAVAIVIAAVAVGAAHDATVRANANAVAARHLAAANRRAVVAIQVGRSAAIRESCQKDEALADVVRKALLGFGVGQPGNPAPPGVVEAFKPLGGLRPLTDSEQAKRCNARVRDGLRRSGP